MLKGLRNIKQQKAASQYAALKSLPRRFLDWCYEKQSRVAASLQVAFEQLSPRTRVASVLVFLVACMITFTSIIANSVKIRSPVDAQVYLIKLPRALITNKTGGEPPVYILNTADEQRITRFKKYMDSLCRNGSGRTIHDSILKARPGLMDSISKLDNLVHSIINEK